MLKKSYKSWKDPMKLDGIKPDNKYLKAFNLGSKARQYCRSIDKNPYRNIEINREDLLYKEWENGWYEEDNRIKNEKIGCTIYMQGDFCKITEKERVINYSTNINYTNENLFYCVPGEVVQSENGFVKKWRTFVQGATAYKFGISENPYITKRCGCRIDFEKAKAWNEGWKHEERKRGNLMNIGTKRIFGLNGDKND